uniref:Uncharacterized protein n=1 Tax=Avena sativa TaxID=4498 RepID=A0ACD5XHJ7_AVESA
MKNRGNRLTSKYKVHRGGSNSLTTICQKLSEKEGREVSKIEAWMHTHRGADPNKPDVLNSVEASKCLDLYKQKVANVHGKDYDWLHSPIVPQALYEAGKGKPHGKWSLFNGVVDDKETLREVQISRSSSSSKRQRQENDRRIAEQQELIKRHALSMTEWGKSVQATVENSLGVLHKFLMTVAALQGIPGPEIPQIVIPPPPAFPTSTTSSPSPSPSPVFSLELRSAGESVNGAENDNALHMAGEGMFGGFFDANGNDANSVSVGNLSPPGDDLPTF